uniref:Uncharacterized protein n=1 Tax=Cannabis sativa TaxID=3483 RepID=A0A803R0E6_CANSA
MVVGKRIMVQLGMRMTTVRRILNRPTQIIKNRTIDILLIKMKMENTIIHGLIHGWNMVLRMIVLTMVEKKTMPPIAVAYLKLESVKVCLAIGLACIVQHDKKCMIMNKLEEHKIKGKSIEGRKR